MCNTMMSVSAYKLIPNIKLWLSKLFKLLTFLLIVRVLVLLPRLQNVGSI